MKGMPSASIGVKSICGEEAPYIWNSKKGLTLRVKSCRQFYFQEVPLSVHPILSFPLSRLLCLVEFCNSCNSVLFFKFHLIAPLCSKQELGRTQLSHLLRMWFLNLCIDWIWATSFLVSCSVISSPINSTSSWHKMSYNAWISDVTFSPELIYIIIIYILFYIPLETMERREK